VGYGVYCLLQAKKLTLRELITAFFVSIIPQVIGGLLQATHVLPFMDTNRVTVAYRWPNTFARYMMVILLISLPWALTVQRKYQYAVAAVLLGGWAVLLLSFSYNANVAFLIAVGVLLLLLPKQYQRIRIGGMLAIFILAILAVSQASKLPKFATTITNSKDTRIEFWQIATSTIQDNLWTGIGLKGWETIYPQLAQRYDAPPLLSPTSPQPHNFILDSLLKAGIPGAIAITLFLAWPAALGWRMYRREEYQKTYGGLVGITVSLALLLFGLIDDPIWSDDMMPVIFSLLLAASWCYSKGVKEATQKTQ
jgi:O-antigen ligase